MHNFKKCSDCSSSYVGKQCPYCENVDLMQACEALTKQNKRMATIENKAEKYEIMQSRMIKASKSIQGKNMLIREECEWDSFERLLSSIEGISEERDRYKEDAERMYKIATDIIEVKENGLEASNEEVILEIKKRLKNLSMSYSTTENE